MAKTHLPVAPTQATPNSCARTGCLLIMLLIGAVCLLIGAISSSSVLLIGIIFGVGGVISLVFSAFQHTHFAQIFDMFIDWLSGLPYLQWAKFIVRPLLFCLLFLVPFTAVIHIPAINDRICQRTFVSWHLVCGDAFGTLTENVPDSLGGSPQVKIGLIDSMTDAPFDTGDNPNAEKDLEASIFAENQAIGQKPHITLAVLTELSRTGDDDHLSADVGLADLEGAYLFQKYANSQPTPTIKLRLVVGNIGTRLTADATVPLLMGRIALLSKQDSTFRGILGLPFSGSSMDALHSRNDLSLTQIPLISPAASSDDLSTIKNFYRVVSSNKTQSCVELDFIVNYLLPALGDAQKPQVNIAVFKDPADSYSNGLANDMGAVKTGNIGCSSYSQSLNTSRLRMLPEGYTIEQPPQDFQKSIDDAIHQQVDVVFFSGYSYDLNNFETILHQEQETLHNQKRIIIVGGDGLYEATGSDNVYNTTYATIYTPPLTGTASDTEKYFYAQYQQNFGNSALNQISSGIMFPPHALEMFDAAHAFAVALQDQTSLPTQGQFDQALQDIDFQGLTGSIQFDTNQTSDQNKGISDPFNKNIYIMCTNKNAITEKAATYIPGPTPDITSYLSGQNLLNCTAP